MSRSKYVNWEKYEITVNLFMGKAFRKKDKKASVKKKNRRIAKRNSSGATRILVAHFD